MQLGSTLSLFFSAALKLLLGFSQPLQKRPKIQMFLAQAERDTDHVTRKIDPLYGGHNLPPLVPPALLDVTCNPFL